jgi:hypothetical protein
VLFLVDVVFHHFGSLLELALLVVVLVLQGQEVLVKRNSVAEKSFVARSLVLLIDFTRLEKFDLQFHGRDLLLQVVNED